MSKDKSSSFEVVFGGPIVGSTFAIGKNANVVNGRASADDDDQEDE